MKLFQPFCAFPVLLLLAAGLLWGCSGKTAISPVVTELFPLEPGRFWVYDVQHGETHETVENHIKTSLTIGSTEWFLSEEYGEKFWIRNGPQGQVEAVNLYTKGENAAVFEHLDPKSLHEELMFKFPARSGESWITLENTLRYEGLRSLVVPAGTFNCHYYSISQYGQTYSHTCIAEGLGVVYSDNTLPDGSLEISRLQSWGKH